MTIRDAVSRLLSTLRRQKGVLFARSAIVHRNTYRGQGILGKNSSPENGDTDHRGYLPVEWWIMSISEAENPIKQEHEGLTWLLAGDGDALRLKDAIAHAEEELLGGAAQRWPLTKILDIGGEPKTPDFSDTPEVPPIPAHVHSGYIVDGEFSGPGKKEAYFLPPPRTAGAGPSRTVYTRLGIKPGTTKEEVVDAVERFGTTDALYALLNAFPMAPYDGWTIESRILHAPGPWTTLEIQTPQDDFNLLAWQLGDRLTESERAEKKASLAHRGVQDAEKLVREGIDWGKSTAADFKDRNYKPARVLEENAAMRRLQIFFGTFYGEALEINPGATIRVGAEPEARAGMVWSGTGTINGMPIASEQQDRMEFLITPNAAPSVTNTGTTTLVLFLLHPLRTD